MTVPWEALLRDQLAENITLIESGLTLVRGEYPLPNAHGTRGRIDLLARDRHGMWVVIEIKRADNAARDALHEVAKYTELLRREKGLRPDYIRAIIVSVTWDELLVPVSNMARDWQHDLRGYRLNLDAQGSLAAIERVEFLPAAREPRVTPIHFIYFFDSAEDRDRGWQAIVHRAAEVGAHDLLGADFRRVARFDLIYAQYGLYFAVGRMDPAEAPPGMSPTYDGPEPFADEYPLEYQALCHICKHVFGATFESAVPGVIRKITDDPGWQVEQARTAGEFAKRDPLSERELVRELAGDTEGIGQILFTGSANTRIATRWTAFLSETKTGLSGNPDWTALLDLWLTGVSRHPADTDVMVHTYNPCDLRGRWSTAWTEGSTNSYQASSASQPTKVAPSTPYGGALYWNGVTVPDIAGLISVIYSEPFAWAAAGFAGIRWGYDLELIELLGLRYMLYERTGDNPFGPVQEGDEQAMWMVCGGVPTRMTAPFQELQDEGWKGTYGLSEFVFHHLPHLQEVVREYRRQLTFVDA